MAAEHAVNRRPSDQEWATHLPRICDLYFSQRMTLEETQRVMRREAGFNATLRMYKGRIATMGVHPKKISMQKYLAMYVIAENFASLGQPVHFTGPSGLQSFKRTPAQVVKQLKRPHNLQPITLDEANLILQAGCISVVVEPTAIKGQSSLKTTSDTVSATAGSSMGAQCESPPCEVSEYAQLSHSSGLSHRLKTNTNHSFNIPDRPSWTASDYDQSETETPQTPIQHEAGTLNLAGMTFIPDLLCRPRTLKDEDDSFDFVEEFNSFSLSDFSVTAIPSLSATVKSRLLPQPVANPSRRIAVETAAPFLASLFPAQGLDTLIFSKNIAMYRFKQILNTTPDNRYILPLLSWMSTVLSTNGQIDRLQDFVHECCQVFDEHREHGSALATPYRYLLAFCEGDSIQMTQLGSQLASTTERLVQLYGPDHPNVLVSDYYRAWHELTKPGGWGCARTILETCLRKAERVMGHQNLMTINCLTVLGRGFSENDLHEDARAILRDAVERLGLTTLPLQGYRLLILQRLAAEDEYLGDLKAAVRGYREVYEGRARLLPSSDPTTHAAMCSLARALRSDGSSREARDVERHHERLQQLELTSHHPRTC